MSDGTRYDPETEEVFDSEYNFQNGAKTERNNAQTAQSDFPMPPPRSPVLSATPFDPAALKNLEPRKWVYGHFLIRRFLSVLGAPGGTGKTVYAVTVGVSVALDRPILTEPVHEAGPVWIYNLEDPGDEALRRLWAILLHHQIDPQDLVGRLFMDSGREKPLVVAEKNESGVLMITPVVEELVEELKARKIKLFIIDPFVKSHRLEENRNDHVDFAATLWNKVASEADCSILMLHHFRKGGMSGDADAFRGASALIDAARAAVSLSTMSEKEAERLGVSEGDRRFHIRMDNAKLNLAPPPTEALWLKLNGVELPNGDKVQAVSKWTPPSAWDGLSMSRIVAILDHIAAGKGDERYTASASGPDGSRWAGRVIVEMADKTEGQARDILRAWVENGLLTKSKYRSPIRRKDVLGLVVDTRKLNDMRRSMRGSADDCPF